MMNNLTDTILVKDYNYQIEEFAKQGTGLQFDSGLEQRIVKYSIPSMTIQISYSGLNWAEYELIRNAYENNHSNTFICEFETPSETVLYVAADYVVTDYIDETISRIDTRAEVMGIDSAVWGFKEFDFNINAKTLLYNGTISLVTSVFFNYTEYQDLFSQSSSYTISPSTDEAFINILDDASPFEARLGYANNALFSSIGQSLRHAKNKGGLKRTWTLKWILEETNFLKLLTYYRKKSGIMGEFGFPDYGTNSGTLAPYVEADYIVDQLDYLQSAASDNLSNARFMQDSFKYNKRVDGLYTCEADFMEVKL